MLPRIAYATIFVTCWQCTAAAGEIHLRSNCTSAETLVTLGDVADIYATDAAEGQRLARVELFPAPADGGVRRVSARELYDLLAGRGIDLRENRLAGASAVNIAARQPQRADVAASPEPQPRKNSPEIELANVLVAIRPLAQGEVVQAGDVQLVERPARSVRSDSAGDLRDVVGQELTRAVGIGQTLQQSALRSPRLVRRNEEVTLIIKANGFQVRSSVKALEDGGLDDLISLQSSYDREKFTARVVGYKKVEMLAGAPQVHETAIGAARPPLVSRVNQPVAIGRRERATSFGLRVQASDATGGNR